MTEGRRRLWSATGRSAGWWKWWLLTSVVAVLAGSSVLVLDSTRRPSESRATGPPDVVLAAGQALLALGADESEFLAARDQLLRALEQRRASLPPEANASLDENLGIVRNAMVELARALEKDPENPRLTRLLAAACRKELELLRQASNLPERPQAAEAPG